VLSQALEESEELVVGSIPTGLSIERCNCIENPLLQLKVGIQINLRGLDRLMAKPFDALLQQIHRCCVSKHMRAYALVLQRWAGTGCRGDVLGQ
jgi:hypothetical protein